MEAKEAMGSKDKAAEHPPPSPASALAASAAMGPAVRAEPAAPAAFRFAWCIRGQCPAVRSPARMGVPDSQEATVAEARVVTTIRRKETLPRLAPMELTAVRVPVKTR